MGAGAVGLRKIHSLLPCAPDILTVVDPAPADASLAEAVARGDVIYRQRGFLPGDATGNHLVFAASGNGAVNALVADICRAGGILCNIADAPEASTFVPAKSTVMALARKKPSAMATSFSRVKTPAPTSTSTSR